MALPRDIDPHVNIDSCHSATKRPLPQSITLAVAFASLLFTFPSYLAVVFLPRLFPSCSQQLDVLPVSSEFLVPRHLNCESLPDRQRSCILGTDLFESTCSMESSEFVCFSMVVCGEFVEFMVLAPCNE